MIEKFIDRSECRIDRLNGYALLIDNLSGQILWSFDQGVGAWTDAQIFSVLDFANCVFSEGIAQGKSEKMQELRRVIFGVEQ